MSASRKSLTLSSWLIWMVLGARAADPQPPTWPPQFHAVLKQNRSGALADVDLWYDWPGGQNLNIIRSENDTLWDNERNNGSTYYYHPAQSTCKRMYMGVGILRPDWLAGADYHGVDKVSGHKVNVFSKNSSTHQPFVTYYCDVDAPYTPVRWVFFDDATFDVVKWIPDEVLDEASWQIPAYCFA